MIMLSDMSLVDVAMWGMVFGFFLMLGGFWAIMFLLIMESIFKKK